MKNGIKTNFVFEARLRCAKTGIDKQNPNALCFMKQSKSNI